ARAVLRARARAGQRARLPGGAAAASGAHARAHRGGPAEARSRGGDTGALGRSGELSGIGLVGGAAPGHGARSAPLGRSPTAARGGGAAGTRWRLSAARPAGP